MTDDRHFPYSSWGRPGEFADPDSPAGGCGPGHAANADPRADSLSPGWLLPPGAIKAVFSAFNFSLPGVIVEQRIKAVCDAIIRAPAYVPRAIYDATGEELGDMVKGLVPGLLMLLGVMAATTAFGVVVGAALGALLGALAFGVGAVPGAVAGGELGGQLGFDAGVAVLNWLGVAFLVAYIGKSLLQCVQTAGAAVAMAWRSVDDHGTQQVVTDRAAHKLAKAIGLLFRGLLQGIIAFLLAKGTAAAAERLPEVVAKLRASKLGAGFAEWIEKNALRLINEPKLKDDWIAPGDTAGGGARSGGSGRISGEKEAAERLAAERAAAERAAAEKKAAEEAARKAAEEKAATERAPPSSGKKLLPGEGKVGTYSDLIKAGAKGDNVTPHHIPSASRMELEGVSKGDGIAINMEQPSPGVGGRHRDTFTYGTKADENMTPREALAAGVRDARRIYQSEGLYTPEIRSRLRELIRMNKAKYPKIFSK